MIYMCTRLIVNVTQVYTPLYMLEVVDLDRVSSWKFYACAHVLSHILSSPAWPKLLSLYMLVDFWPVLLSSILINIWEDMYVSFCVFNCLLFYI